jgi:hypothetical protein
MHVDRLKTYMARGKNKEGVTSCVSEKNQSRQRFRNAGAMSITSKTIWAAVLTVSLASLPPNVEAFQSIFPPESRFATPSRFFRSCATPRSSLPTSMAADTVIIEAGTGGDAERAALILKSKGYSRVEIRGSSDSGQRASPLYRYMPAVGMYKLTNGQEYSSLALPTWLSPEPTEESLLEARGWGYLSPDPAEPLSALDIDAANQESTYVPAWAAGVASCGEVSPLGFNITRMSQNQVLEAAQEWPQLSQDVLLRGVTEPVVRHVCQHSDALFFSLVTTDI